MAVKLTSINKSFYVPVFSHVSFMRGKAVGFTAVEILVVVFITVLFVAFAVPGMIHMYDVYNANGVADQMAGDIRYAEQLAITNVNNYYMQLNTATGTPNNSSIDSIQNSYAIYYIISTTVSTTTTTVKTVTMSNTCSIASTGFANNLITFTPNGSDTPLADGGIQIVQNYDKGTTHYWVVTIKYSTGKVRIFEDTWPSSY